MNDSHIRSIYSLWIYVMSICSIECLSQCRNWKSFSQSDLGRAIWGQSNLGPVFDCWIKHLCLRLHILKIEDLNLYCIPFTLIYFFYFYDRKWKTIDLKGSFLLHLSRHIVRNFKTRSISQTAQKATSIMLSVNIDMSS